MKKQHRKWNWHFVHSYPPPYPNGENKTKGVKERERYKKSAIPYLQRILNSCESEQKQIIRSVGFK